MTQTDYLGDKFIGQANVRKAVNFFIEGQKSNGILPPLLLASQRGSGKTELARLISKNLIDPDTKQNKPWIEINGASVQKIKSFVDSIIVPHVSGDKPITLFFDEFAGCSSEIKDWFLSILQPNGTNITSASHAGEVYTFDARKFSVIMATTNPEDLSKPLVSRMTRIELEPYTNPDLVKILTKNIGEIELLDSVENEIISICRQSPREVVKAGQNVVQYCSQNRISKFGASEWCDLKAILNIKPLGLTSNEIELLKFLKLRGAQTLTAIGAKLRLDVTTVRKDIEQFLLCENLIKIDGKRHLSDTGLKILDTIEQKT